MDTMSRAQHLDGRGSHVATCCRTSDRGPLGCYGLLLGGVIGTTDQRTRLDVHEAKGFSLALQLHKLIRMIIALDRQMLP